MTAANRHLTNGMRVALALLLSLALASRAYADDPDPSARVARLAHLLGEVSIEAAGVDEWAAAELNRPLTTGDKIWSDADSRVEISIGSAVVRLGSATGFSFLNLDDHTAQMQLTAGTASFHVRTLAQNETLEVDTPNSVVSLLGPGDYRVEVNDAGDSSVVKVSGGTAEVTAGGQDFPVHLQQQITLNGTTEVSADVTALGTPDAFDAWTFERDRRAQVAQVSNYVSRKSSARRILIRTAPGSRRPMRAMCGRQAASRSTGRPITTAIGFGLHPGAGPGLTLPPGDLRLFITVAGQPSAAAGAGCPGLEATVRCTPRRLSPGWAERPWAQRRRLAAALALPGLRSARARSMFPPTP